jgi:hypothetical protein
VVKILFNPAIPNQVFAVSTTNGIYISNDSGESWSIFCPDHPLSDFTSLAITDDGTKLYAGTLSGLYEMIIDSGPCEPEMTIVLHDTLFSVGSGVMLDLIITSDCFSTFYFDEPTFNFANIDFVIISQSGDTLYRTMPTFPGLPDTYELEPGDTFMLTFDLENDYRFSSYEGRFYVKAIYQSLHNIDGEEDFWTGILESDMFLFKYFPESISEQDEFSDMFPELNVFQFDKGFLFTIENDSGTTHDLFVTDLTGKRIADLSQSLVKCGARLNVEWQPAHLSSGVYLLNYIGDRSKITKNIVYIR